MQRDAISRQSLLSAETSSLVETVRSDASDGVLRGPVQDFLVIGLEDAEDAPLLHRAMALRKIVCMRPSHAG